MTKYLWNFEWPDRRGGGLEGLFVATQEDIDDLIGKDVYFGEVLGKHSEVCGTIDDGEVTKVDIDIETIEKVSAVLGNTWSGYNPLHYLSEDEEDEE